MPSARQPAPPALYPCTIIHARTAPQRYALRHRTYMWLVDPDRLPALPLPLRPLARFRARDHFTGRAPSIRAALDGFLGEHGIDLQHGPVLMLTHARVLGYVFNPLTLYWCHDPDGAPRCVVAEVHNTYGERHAYLLHPDRAGTAHVDKEFYVSPFLPVDGRYHMRLPLPWERLDLTVRLDRPGGAPFTAAVRGSRCARSPQPRCCARPCAAPGPPWRCRPQSASTASACICGACPYSRAPAAATRRVRHDHS